MEVREEGVHHAETVAWMDEQVRPATTGADVAVLIHGTLERAGGGRADRNDATASGLSGSKGPCNCRADGEPFGLHHVLFDAVHANRLERAVAHVQRERRPSDARGPQA